MVGWNTEYIGGVDSSDSYIVDLVEIFLDLWFGHGLGDSENVGTYRMRVCSVVVVYPLW